MEPELSLSLVAEEFEVAVKVEGALETLAQIWVGEGVAAELSVYQFWKARVILL